MGKQIAAVLGTGQTRHASRRTDVSMAGLCREAVDRAMADAEVEGDQVEPLAHDGQHLRPRRLQRVDGRQPRSSGVDDDRADPRVRVGRRQAGQR